MNFQGLMTMKNNKEIILYILFGVLTTFVNITTFLLFETLLNYKVANIIAFIISIYFAYITNKLYVFKSRKTASKYVMLELINFFISRIVTFLIDILLMILLVEILDINSLQSKFFVNIIVIVLNYIISKRVVFKN